MNAQSISRTVCSWLPALVLLLMFVGTGFAQERTYTPEEARDILSDPEKFAQTCKPAERELGSKSEDVARQLLDLVKDDQMFLRQVYELYANDKGEGHVASNSISRMNAGDDAYFKQIFERAGSNNTHQIRGEALRKINDLEYVKTVIAEEASANEGFDSPAASFLLIRGEELYRADPSFVDGLAETAADTYVREAAIGATSNLAILRKYAGLSDEEVDQHRHPPGSAAADQAFHNAVYRWTARVRLEQLGDN